jgi:hypothetical protein
MSLITVKLPPKHVELLIRLASDQLFRREFIDPRMPGNHVNREEVNMGKDLVKRLQLLVEKGVKDAV